MTAPVGEMLELRCMGNREEGTAQGQCRQAWHICAVGGGCGHKNKGKEAVVAGLGDRGTGWQGKEQGSNGIAARGFKS